MAHKILVLLLALVILPATTFARIDGEDKRIGKWRFDERILEGKHRLAYAMIESKNGNGDILAISVRYQDFDTHGGIMMFSASIIITTIHMLANLDEGGVVSPLWPWTRVKIGDEYEDWHPYVDENTISEARGRGYNWAFKNVAAEDFAARPQKALMQILNAREFKIDYLQFLNMDRYAHFDLEKVREAYTEVKRMAKVPVPESKKPAHIKP